MTDATFHAGPEAPDADAAELPRSAAAPAEAAPALPPGFALRRDGLYWFPPEDDAAPVHVCGPLTVAALTHDGAGRDWGCLLQWLDGDGREHQWAMPRSLLAGDGAELRAHLLSRGLFVAPGRKARDKLAEYLMRSAPRARVRVVGRLGWHIAGDGRRVFVLPEETLGAPGAERVMLQTDRPDALPPLRAAGTLQGWKAEVAAPAVGNSRLAFALSAAFAAPLLGPLDAEGGGFHLRGASSGGKSTTLHVAGSVWGGGGLHGWARSWRSTDNGLEAVAAAHNDLLLALDEMGEAEPEAAAAAAYMLANGCGKGRAARDGGSRRAAEWRLLFLSSGEVGLADRLAEARGGPRRPRAGQEVRVLDLPAEAGPHGLFETLHGHADGATLADALRDATRRHYGVAGRAWLEVLAADPDGFAAQARVVMATFLRDYVPPDAGGQVRRAAARFALVAAAGELAIGADILPWLPGEAMRAAATCFQAWLAAREAGAGSAEDAAALAAVRGFLERHGEARFTTLTHGADGEATEGDRPTINRAGWRRRGSDGVWRYLILPETWRSEVCAGLDPQRAARALMARGFLDPGEGGRPTQKPRIPGIGPTRVYVVRATILAE